MDCEQCKDCKETTCEGCPWAREKAKLDQSLLRELGQSLPAEEQSEFYETLLKEEGLAPV